VNKGSALSEFPFKSFLCSHMRVANPPCSGAPLFPVNRDDDMAYPQGLYEAQSWSEGDMRSSIAPSIKDPAAVPHAPTSPQQALER